MSSDVSCLAYKFLNKDSGVAKYCWEWFSICMSADLAMQLNQGKFEYNGACGWV